MNTDETPPELTELIDRYLEARYAYAKADERAKRLERDYHEVRRHMAKALTEARMKGVRTDFGVSFSTVDRFSISVTQDNHDDVSAWLHDHYGDVEEFTYAALNKPAITARIKRDIEEELLDDFDVPDFLKLKAHQDISCLGFKEWKARRDRQNGRTE